MALEWAGPLSSPSNWNLNGWSSGRGCQRSFLQTWQQQRAHTQLEVALSVHVLTAAAMRDWIAAVSLFFYNVKRYDDPLGLLPCIFSLC